MSESAVVAILASRPEAELRQLESRLQVELEQVREALARKGVGGRGQAYTAARSPVRTRRGPRAGTLKDRVLKVMAAADGPVTPAEIRDALITTGPPVSGNSIYTAIGRLRKGEQIEKISDGLYELASRNGGSEEAAESGNEEHAPDPPPSTGAIRAEGD